MIIHRILFYTALSVICLTATSTTSAADKPLHLRGEITSVTGNQLVIKANHGTTTTLQLSNELQVLDVFRTELSAIAENSGDKTQTISIDTATIFGQFVPGTRSLLVKGAKILIFVNPTEGTLPIAEMVMVGRAGFLPPI